MAVAPVILAMVTIGGLTRLTGSGLSITQWDPIMGAIPPLNNAAWADAFAKYKLIPQYIVENQGMTLDGFKGIFWWEWSHRLLGRLLGVVFLVPFLWFAGVGAIRRADWPRMLLLFCWAGCRALSAGGWWQSGLEVRTSVSQYRLAIHLGTALLLLVAILWIALEYLRGGKRHGKACQRAFVFAGLVYFQMLLGALVAGLHAGLIYNTWPDMNGHVLPEDPFFASPGGSTSSRIRAWPSSITVSAPIWSRPCAVHLCARHQADRRGQDQRQGGGRDHHLPDRPGHHHADAAGAGSFGRGASGHRGVPALCRCLACV